MYNSGTILHILFAVQGGVETPFAFVTNKNLIEPAIKQVNRLFPNLTIQTNEVLGYNYWHENTMFVTLDESQHVVFGAPNEQTRENFISNVEKWKETLNQVSTEGDRVGSFTTNILAAIKTMKGKNEKKKADLLSNKFLSFLFPVGKEIPSMDEMLSSFQYVLSYVENANFGVKTVVLPKYDINIILFPETVENWIAGHLFPVDKPTK